MHEDDVVVVEDFVPVIDLASRDTADGRAAIADAIRSACESSGFFTVIGHGVPPGLVARMHAATELFFTQPAEAKDLVGNCPGVTGFRRFGEIVEDGERKPGAGLYEAFAAHVTGELPDAERARLGDYDAPWKVANAWPGFPGDFRSTWLEYMAAMTDLSRDVMRLFATALALDEGFFDDKFDRHVSLVLANYYYPQAEAPVEGQLRRGQHTDWGSLTVLYQQDDKGGLQVLHDDWLDVPAVPGSFVVNIGDLMAFWTGGRWKSTIHRVLNPAPGDTSSRISIPFFYMPNHDARIEPMHPITTAEHTFDSVTIGQWLNEKMKIKLAEPAEEAG